MPSMRKGSISKKAVAALVVAGALGLQPLGSQGAEAPVTIRGLLRSGDTMVDPTCDYHGCALFAGAFGQHPDKCFNNNAGLPRQNVDLRKEIFGADPQGNPAEESWGGKLPFLNVKDLSPYTGKAARTVRFTLDDSGGSHGNGVSRLATAYRDANCTDIGGERYLWLAEQETRTFTVPRGTKWFLLFAWNNIAGETHIHLDEKWHMVIQ